LRKIISGYCKKRAAGIGLLKWRREYLLQDKKAHKITYGLLQIFFGKRISCAFLP
jgi:hypothetical protein